MNEIENIESEIEIDSGDTHDPGSGIHSEEKRDGGGNMDIVGLLRKERAELMGKVNAVDAALRLLGGGNAPRAKSPMPEKDRLRRTYP
jgi:hypothetical protein